MREGASVTNKKPENRNALDHIKAGVKNIPNTYNTLYNREMGGAKTAAQNVRIITKGNTGSGMPKIAPATRAKLAVMGAASVTPLGPVAAFASGVAKSVEKKAAAKAAATKPAPAPAAAPTLAKRPAQSPAKSPAKPASSPAAKPTAAPASGVQIGSRGRMPPLPAAPKAPASKPPSKPVAASKPVGKKA
jgi:hypothetical protein